MNIITTKVKYFCFCKKPNAVTFKALLTVLIVHSSETQLFE